MERLTSNKPVDEMSMVELAHNACYAENRKAMYRDFETVRDARDFARELYEAYVNEELPNDDDEFEGRMIDDLQYEPTIHANGLIALFYRNLWAMADLREKLKYYEDAEEQWLLLRLPCPIGTTVYKFEPFNNKPTKYIETIITRYDVYGDSVWFCFANGLGRNILDFGKTVFFTKEAAEQALKQMGE